MDSISPAFDDALVQRSELRLPRVLKSPAFWAGVSMVALFATVAMWRLGICGARVLACG